MERLFTVKRVSLSGLVALKVGLLFAIWATSPMVARATATEFKPAPFSKYQTILDRMPFGALPPNFGEAPAAAPAQTDAQVQAEQKKLAQQINMSCINVTPDGATAIGFTDLSAKPPVNFYLLVGATGGGWTVVNANYDEEWAQIEKEGVTITLKLGKGLIDAPPTPAAATAATAGAPAAAPAAVTTAPLTAPASPDQAVPRPSFVKRPSYGGRPSVNIASLNRSREEMAQVREEIEKIKKEGGDVGSYMERLRQRKVQEQEEKAAAEETARVKLQELAKKITQDELAKREREMNLNLLMQGAKPISDIELTPEEEAALVDRGVLAQ